MIAKSSLRKSGNQFQKCSLNVCTQDTVAILATLWLHVAKYGFN